MFSLINILIFHNQRQLRKDDFARKNCYGDILFVFFL
jgi:hypothetical protein